MKGLDKRWSIYIDIEGFGSLYDKEDTVLLALGDLMEGIYAIGLNCFPETPHRLFAHQTGDGFVIVSEFYSDSLEVPAAIAIALLRHISVRGRFAKAAISEGEFAGIDGCYPKRVRDAKNADGRVFMGHGLMTTFPVMGTALINAVAIANSSPSGAILTLAKVNSTRLPEGCIVHKMQGSEIVSIDWVHSEFSKLAEIQERAGLHTPDKDKLRNIFAGYFYTQKVKEEWKANTNWLLSLGIPANDA